MLPFFWVSFLGSLHPILLLYGTGYLSGSFSASLYICIVLVLPACPEGWHCGSHLMPVAYMSQWAVS